jgi:hypothetical protein
MKHYQSNFKNQRFTLGLLIEKVFILQELFFNQIYHLSIKLMHQKMCLCIIVLD